MRVAVDHRGFYLGIFSLRCRLLVLAAWVVVGHLAVQGLIVFEVMLLRLNCVIALLE